MNERTLKDKGASLRLLNRVVMWVGVGVCGLSVGCTVDNWEIRKAIDVCGGVEKVDFINYSHNREITCVDGTVHDLQADR